ncbi:MAG: hypothetical protein N2319_09655 [Candidatus Kapabacteria bacterium]|nr:hypothetical protein [Candidatus Kapabacteria bacterium]
MRIAILIIFSSLFVLLSCNSTNEPTVPVKHQNRIIVGKVEFDSAAQEPKLIIDFPEIDTATSNKGIYKIWVEVENIIDNSLLKLRIWTNESMLVYEFHNSNDRVGHYYVFPAFKGSESANPYKFNAILHNLTSSKDSLLVSRIIDFRQK